MPRPGRRFRAAGLVLALVAVAGVQGAPGAAPSHAAAVTVPPAASGQQHRWVTLVTGDRVLLRIAGDAEQVVTVLPAKGREGAKFLHQAERGDTYVVPADVAPLVAAKRVDRRLFNVSKLVEFGYDDSKRADVPLIVTYADGAAARAAGSRLRGASVKRELPSIRGNAVAVPKDAASGFWKSVRGADAHTLAGGATRVWLDGKVRATLDRSVPQIGAPAAWQAGHTGKGAKVAVLDTGVDATHPDLADAVSAAQDFTGSASGTADKFGHGTHVAGIITGSGAVVGGKYKGVAPDATILNGKVLDDMGGGDESWIIAGMQWAVAQGADVVNMSLGSPFPSDGTEPMDLAVNQLTRDSGTLFVISAGNSGPSGKSISSPGAADEALTVGAVDKQDQLAEFSSRGPRWRDLALKPDITAPGVDIVAPLADGALLGDFEPVVDGRYLKLSGTSMAAPHVAGAAAILAAQRPQWTAEQLKPALTGTAAPHDGLTVYEQGAGRVDVARATAQQVVASPASVSLGVQQWPHTDDKPVSRTLTYRNDGTVPVTLDLAADVRDPAGKTAPAGMFTLDKQQLTVPAGGTASVTLVADTSVAAPDGSYGGAVTATAGQTRVRTPVAVTREVESYNLTVTVVDRDGNQTPEYFSRLVDIAQPEAILPYDASGRSVVRVPKGHHYFETTIGTPDPSDPVGWNSSQLIEPDLVVDRDLTLVLDARDAKPVGFAVAQPKARPGGAAVQFARRTAWGDTGVTMVMRDFDGLYVLPSRTTALAGEFTYGIAADLAEPDTAGGFTDSPYLYHVIHTTDGRVPTDLVPRVADRDLAKVTTRIAAAKPGQQVSKDFVVTTTAPATITEYYTPGRTFQPSLYVPRPGGEPFEFVQYINSAPVTYQKPGGNRVERWNVGVFGPAFIVDGSGDPSVGREGNSLDAFPQMYGDQAPNRAGSIVVDTAKLVLYRNGEKIGESREVYGRWDVPAEPGEFRLTADHTHSVSTLSTKTSAAWTFRSSRTDQHQALPLMAVRFAPPLDDNNSAKAGRPFAFPVYVQRQAGASYGSLTDLTVRVSYDDGKTWQPVRLIGTGLNRVALVNHPAGDGFVSLQATAVDSNGNKVEQTITRAYAIRA